MYCVMSMGRRVRACTRLLKAAKALATRDHVRGISGLSAPSNSRDVRTVTAVDNVISVLVAARTCGGCKRASYDHATRGRPDHFPAQRTWSHVERLC
jgi:hypothetical protein